MPRISLKPNSPEFAENEAQRHPQSRACDAPGCRAHGEFRAPKDRGLQDYYWFCLEHVQAYNKAWDYFSGMSQRDIENYIVDSMLGNRPTWVYGVNGDISENLHAAAWRFYMFKESEPEAKDTPELNAPEREALNIMGLDMPVTLAEIKTHYKNLAKQHHPDHNPGDKEAEERLKRINMAYTILKLAFKDR